MKGGRVLIGVDAGCLGITDRRLQVGVFQVVRNLLVQLGKLDKKNEYLLYSFAPIEKSLLNSFGPRMKNVVVKPSKGWLAVWLPLQLLKDKPDVFLATSQASPLKLLTQQYKTIGVFYDIAFKKFPELYAYGANVKKHQQQSENLAKSADKIIAISGATKKDVHNAYQMPLKKITVAYPGISTFSKKEKYHTTIPYFLFVGAYKKTKNIPVLLQAFDFFLQKSEMPFDLVLVGGDKWLDPEIAKTVDKISRKTKKHIRKLGFVQDNLLGDLYAHAVAFVSPSLYEGFGLPFLEAQKMGCPVIGSERGALPEVLRNSAVLVDPTNPTELSKIMDRIVRDRKYRLDLVAKGKENSQKYTWKSFAKTVQSVLASA